MGSPVEMEISLDLVVKAKRKKLLEAKPLEEAVISALWAGKVAFQESDFLAWRQQTLQFPKMRRGSLKVLTISHEDHSVVFL